MDLKLINSYRPMQVASGNVHVARLASQSEPKIHVTVSGEMGRAEIERLARFIADACRTPADAADE
jgi:hypothetical protein